MLVVSQGMNRMNGGWFGVSHFSHYHKRKGIVDEMMTTITPTEEDASVV